VFILLKTDTHKIASSHLVASSATDVGPRSEHNLLSQSKVTGGKTVPA